MLKELRSWFQMLDGIKDGTDRLATVKAGLNADRRHDAYGAHAPNRSLVFIVGDDSARATALAAILSVSGLDTTMLADGQALAAALTHSKPDLVFIDISAQGERAFEALDVLRRSGFDGGVQLVGEASSPVTEAARRAGGLHQLTMLPPVARPLTLAGLRRILRDQNLAVPENGPVVNLGEALANDWLEFWYQPKIDLKKRQIMGVETFARIRHPELGALQPDDFLPGASQDDLIALSERALVAALKAAHNFARLGIALRLAVNMPVDGLLTLPIRQMVQELGPNHHKWPGLLLDVTEAQITQNLAEVQAVSRGLTACGVHLAIDDFGHTRLSLGMLRALPIAELKLDRAYVADCAVDLESSSVCRSVIDLGHHLGCVTVGVGVEKAADLIVLQSMGCDLGQGYLFGQPMPEDTLTDMMLQRVVAPPPRLPARPIRALATGAARTRWN